MFWVSADYWIAQYYETADHLIILGERAILQQGSPADVKIKTGSIPKFSGSHVVKDSNTLLLNPSTLSAQVRLQDEAEIDYARQTGDSTLYGINLLSQPAALT